MKPRPKIFLSAALIFTILYLGNEVYNIWWTMHHALDWLGLQFVRAETFPSVVDNDFLPLAWVSMVVLSALICTLGVILLGILYDKCRPEISQ
jgi:hypothetical protein